MNMRFSDMTECSIEFESEDNKNEKQLLRDIYFKLMTVPEYERIRLLNQILIDGDDVE